MIKCSHIWYITKAWHSRTFVQKIYEHESGFITRSVANIKGGGWAGVQTLNTSYLIDHFIPFKVFCQIDIKLTWSIQAWCWRSWAMSGYPYVLFCILCFLIQNKHMNSILPLAKGHWRNILPHAEWFIKSVYVLIHAETPFSQHWE